MDHINYRPRNEISLPGIQYKFWPRWDRAQRKFVPVPYTPPAPRPIVYDPPVKRSEGAEALIEIGEVVASVGLFFARALGNTAAFLIAFPLLVCFALALGKAILLLLAIAL